MGFLGQVWDFLDGKKTAIGGALVLILQALQATGVLSAELSTALQHFGADAIILLGLLHKTAKAL